MSMFVCTGLSTPLRLEIGLRTETNSFAILDSSSQLATVDKSPFHQQRAVPDLVPFNNGFIYKHFMKTAM